MKISHFQLCCEFFPLSPHRAGKKSNDISTGKEYLLPLRKKKKILIKLEEGEAH